MQLCWASAPIKSLLRAYLVFSQGRHVAISCDYRSFQMVGDASMVLSLQRLDCMEDKHLLAGHLIVLQGGDYNTAQASGKAW